MELRARRPRQLKFAGQNTGKEKATQREDHGDLQRVPLEDSAEHRSGRAQEETIQGMESNYQ